MDAITLIAGTWDEKWGKESKIAELIYSGIEKAKVFEETYFRNGGAYWQLKELAPEEITLLGRTEQVVVWMPNVPNHLLKLPGIKELFPKCILVSSKRNTDYEYSFQDVMAHALSRKSNLIIEFNRCSKAKEVSANLFDPLGNQWFSGSNMEDLGIAIAKRAKQLSMITRMGTVQSPEAPYELEITNDLETFVTHVKDAGKIFSDLIRPANGVTRFLGNASFRCESGFPSFRAPGGMIYISKRNVDKTTMDLGAFVATGMHNGKIWYRGDNKPSVDTPIQLALYNMLPIIKYMLHSHVYIKDAPFTKQMIPCGGLEEIAEISEIIMAKELQHVDSFAINLKGHGSILFMREPWLYIHYKFYSRPVPEIMEIYEEKSIQRG